MRLSDPSTQIRLVSTSESEPVPCDLSKLTSLYEGCCRADLTDFVCVTVVSSERCEDWTGSLDTGVGSYSVRFCQA